MGAGSGPESPYRVGDGSGSGRPCLLGSTETSPAQSSTHASRGWRVWCSPDWDKEEPAIEAARLHLAAFAMTDDPQVKLFAAPGRDCFASPKASPDAHVCI